MQLYTGDPPRGVYDGQGKLPILPHPQTGHSIPVIMQDCCVTLDGKPCPFGAFFDEEAGIALVYGEEAGSYVNQWGYRIPLQPLKLLRGQVRIEVRFPDECPCFECSQQRKQASPPQ